MIEIPGDILEGGGQILRTSIALSVIAKKPIRIFNIRARRSSPGLKAQHLNSVKAVAILSDSKVEGLKFGSSEISFFPGTIKGGSFKIDIGTAGSTSLVLQALMPAASFASNKTLIEIKGGTNTLNAPPIDYIQEVLIPTLKTMGFRDSVNLVRRGFYPRGQGIIRSKIEPVKKFIPIQLTEFGEVERIYGLSYSSNLPSHIVERMAKSAEETLSKNGYDDVNIECEVLQSKHKKCALDPGCGITLVAKLTLGSILGANSLGKIGKPAEQVGIEVADNLLNQLEKGVPIDKYLADQAISYISIADGKSTIRTTELTLHTLTCIEISKKILNTKFNIEGELGKPALIECEGIGLENQSDSEL